MVEKLKVEPISREELAELLEELGSIRGRHTELVSVLVPAGANLNVVIDQLDTEKSTARNIKSKTTQKNVIEALERATRQLRMLGQQTPKNGVAIFSGNVSETEGQEDMRIWMIVPPEELNMRLYRCDQVFIIDALKEMLEEKEVYGLFVIDRKESTIGLLEGKKIKILQHLDSGVPGKTRAGGQCLSPDTLIMKSNGELISIEKTHNPLIILSENFNKEESEETPIITKWENNKELFKITTSYPKFEIKASKEHLFFVRTEKGIEEKPLLEIKIGDFLILPEKINLNLEDQIINFKPIVKQKFNFKTIKFPEKINSEISRILGYYLGDGNYEQDRITFSEQREEIALYYKTLIKTLFGIEAKLNFRENKGYYQLRACSRALTQLFATFFGTERKTLNGEMPKMILMSSDKSLASFMAGFFDAEGYVSNNRVAFGINNERLTKQMQFALLRLGIIASVSEYDNRRNPYSDNIRYTLAIDDLESLKKFRDVIGFCSKKKQAKVENLINDRSSRNKVRQLVVNGKDVARILRNSGLSTIQFNCPSFFVNKREMSKEVFRNKILDKIFNLELKKRLELFYNSNLIITKIAKIESIGESKTIDIETKNHNFIANGVIVHNSSQRYARIVEGKAKDFYRECAEMMKKHFFDLKNLKGIIIGGPMPTKDEFVKEGLIVTALKTKIIGMKDIGYADEHGIGLLVEASVDLLAQQAITKERQLMENFFNMLGKQREKTAYGLEPVKKALDIAAVDTLLLSRKLDKKISAELKQKAEDSSAKIEYVSVETEEGQQFWNLSGIGAILRYAMNKEE